MPTSPFSTGTQSDLNLCRPCECCQCLWIHMCKYLIVSGRHWYLGIIHSLRFLNSFYLLCSIVPRNLEGFNEDVPFRIECPKVSHSPYTVQLWVSMFDLPVLLDVLRNLHALGIKGSYTALPTMKQNKTLQISCNTRNKDTGRCIIRTLIPLTTRKDR